MGGDRSQAGGRHRQSVCQTPGSRRAGGRGQCCTPYAALPVARNGRPVPGEREPSRVRQCPRHSHGSGLARLPATPRASGPSRLALQQTAPRPRPAGAPAAASQWQTCCQAESSFEWPNRASQPEPLLIWGPGGCNC